MVRGRVRSLFVYRYKPSYPVIRRPSFQARARHVYCWADWKPKYGDAGHGCKLSDRAFTKCVLNDLSPLFAICSPKSLALPHLHISSSLLTPLSSHSHFSPFALRLYHYVPHGPFLTISLYRFMEASRGQTDPLYASTLSFYYLYHTVVYPLRAAVQTCFLIGVLYRNRVSFFLDWMVLVYAPAVRCFLISGR